MPVNSRIQTGLPSEPDVMQDEDTFREVYRLYQAVLQLVEQVGALSGIDPVPPSLYTSQLVQARNSYHANNVHYVYPVCTAAITVGAAVNFHNSGGLAVRFANASSSATMCHGFALEAGIIGQRIRCVALQGLAPIGGLTPGTLYWLHTVDGQIVNSPPFSPAGTIRQPVGFALETDRLAVAPAMFFGVN